MPIWSPNGPKTLAIRVNTRVNKFSEVHVVGELQINIRNVHLLQIIVNESDDEYICMYVLVR
jgi:hypothetical protein